MCFRPSALNASGSQIETGTCPSCGQPVAADAGTTSGTCPYCGNPIPTNPTNEGDAQNPGNNPRIL